MTYSLHLDTSLNFLEVQLKPCKVTLPSPHTPLIKAPWCLAVSIAIKYKNTRAQFLCLLELLQASYFAKMLKINKIKQAKTFISLIQYNSPLSASAVFFFLVLLTTTYLIITVLHGERWFLQAFRIATKQHALV